MDKILVILDERFLESDTESNKSLSCSKKKNKKAYAAGLVSLFNDDALPLLFLRVMIKSCTVGPFFADMKIEQWGKGVASSANPIPRGNYT